MQKKILAGAVGIAAAAAMLGGGAFASFSDTETSATQSVAAGTLDLQILNSEAPDNTYPEYQPFAVTNVKPGDSSAANGTTKMIHVKNVGTLPGNVTVTVKDLTNDDNGLTEPESLVDSTGGAGEGELAQNMTLSIDGIGAMQNQLLSTLDGVAFPDTYAPLQPGQERWYSVNWSVDQSVGNEIQSDSATFNLVFDFAQS